MAATAGAQTRAKSPIQEQGPAALAAAALDALAAAVDVPAENRAAAVVERLRAADRFPPTGPAGWTRADVVAYLAAADATITPTTWSGYVSRGQAPAAADHVGRTPVWDPATVVAWHATRAGQGWRAGKTGPADRRRPAGPARAGTLDDRLRAAYAELAAEPGAWVALARLRPLLADLPRAEVDEALLRLSRTDDAHVVPENQKTLTRADRAASIRIGGQDKHLVSISTAHKAEHPDVTAMRRQAAAARAAGDTATADYIDRQRARAELIGSATRADALAVVRAVREAVADAIKEMKRTGEWDLDDDQ